MNKKLQNELKYNVEKLILGELRREDVSAWASKLMAEPLNTEYSPEQIEHLDFLMGIDLKTSPTEYFHTIDEISDWFEAFKANFS
jgi:hypothetical protein